MTVHTLLRLLHIVIGAFWVGAAVFIATLLVPSIRAAGPAGGAVMGELAGKRKLPIVLLFASWVTILSGAMLAWRDAGALGMRWFESGAGLVFGIGATSAILGMLVGLFVSAPTSSRIGAIMAHAHGRAPSADEVAQLRILQDRLANAARLIAVLLVIAVAMMATARGFGDTGYRP